MRPILINPNNATALEAALAKANGRAAKHTATAADVFGLAERAELHLDIDLLPKSRRPGAEVAWHAKGPFAQAYRYRMTRTKLSIRRGRKGWYLIGAQRVHLYPGQRELFHFMISVAQRDMIISRTLAPYALHIDQDAADAPTTAAA